MRVDFYLPVLLTYSTNIQLFVYIFRYGCVCHFGSVYGGHYTAFSRHLGSNQWNYFDDSSIIEHKVPGDTPGDHSSGYVLFYQRSGKSQFMNLFFHTKKDLVRAAFHLPICELGI